MKIYTDDVGVAEVRAGIRDWFSLPLMTSSLFGEKPEWRDVIGRKGAYIRTFR